MGKPPSWDEWKGLTEDAKQYEQHRLLISIHDRLDQRIIDCTATHTIVNSEINKLKNRKIIDKAASFAGGVVGGVATWLSSIFFK